MCDATVRDYKISCLQQDYKLLSEVIYHQLKHIDRCLSMNIINVNDRNQYMKILNETTKQLNITYNENISKLCDEDHIDYTADEYDVNISSILDISDENPCFDDINDIIVLWKQCNVTFDEKIKNATELLCQEPLRCIREQIRELGVMIGFYSLDDAIYILSGTRMNKQFNQNDMNKATLFNSIFIPLECSKDIKDDKKYLENLTFKAAESKYDVLLDNCSELLIKDKLNVMYVLKGYFDVDCLGIVIRTSQICYSFIHEKKKELEISLDEIKYINARFKKIYMKNITLPEILSYDVAAFSKKAEEDYEYYAKLIKMLSFRNLMNEFTKDSNGLKNMYRIIRLLLLGTDECINFAGLLYGLSKDKKVGGEIASDIIYRSLSFSSQTKLKKSSISIKNELDKIKSLTVEDVDLKKQLAACKNMPNYVKKCVSEKIEEMKTGSSEYYKQLTYVKMLLGYPWNADGEDMQFLDIKNDFTKCKDFLDSSKKILDDMVYGHDGCKNAIQEMIAKWLSNPKASGKAIGLHGNPGIGKTLIAKGLGKALNIPFVQINLGGLDDGCVLCGHSYTYSAAQPGLVVKKMIEAGSSRCIMYFDELDKACKKHDVNEVYNILIHLTDPNTNQEFSDRFFQEINFPLNKVLFVFSYNSPELVDKILRDRLQEIEVKPYTMADKVAITTKFLIKEICEGIGLNKDMFIIADDVIEYFIENYTHESGVRELKRKIESLFLKLNIDKYYNRGPFNGVDITLPSTKINITIDIVNEYLKKPKINIRKVHNVDVVGITNGLYATTSGQGGLVPIVMNENFSGKGFELKITGSQGKVMKESVEYSYTTAINLIKPEFRQQFIDRNKFGIHVHTPDGATPKDGPSAGCAFTITFLSTILNKRIRHECTLTGEIEPTGKVSAIGGLHYKLIGAKKAGAKVVFVPSENEDDYIEIKEKSPTLFDENFSVVIVSNVYQVAEQMLLEDDGSKFNVETYLILNQHI